MQTPMPRLAQSFSMKQAFHLRSPFINSRIVGMSVVILAALLRCVTACPVRRFNAVLRRSCFSKTVLDAAPF